LLRHLASIYEAYGHTLDEIGEGQLVILIKFHETREHPLVDLALPEDLGRADVAAKPTVTEVHPTMREQRADGSAAVGARGEVILVAGVIYVPPIILQKCPLDNVATHGTFHANQVLVIELAIELTGTFKKWAVDEGSAADCAREVL
jgi:hypothetical protein